LGSGFERARLSQPPGSLINFRCNLYLAARFGVSSCMVGLNLSHCRERPVHYRRLRDSRDPPTISKHYANIFLTNLTSYIRVGLPGRFSELAVFDARLYI
jgi:hypothetical protein